MPRSVFISSCSRHDLARRRPSRYAAQRLQIAAALLVIIAALGAVVLARGGIW